MMAALSEWLAQDRWANLRVLDAAARLTPARLRQSLPGSFPSLAGTLAHLLWAEELWLARWQDRPGLPPPGPAASAPALETIRAGLESVHARQQAFLQGLEPGAEERLVAYLNFKGERWEYSLRRMVWHLTLHSAFHRGQASVQLRLLGCTPPNTDYLAFIDELAGH
jgi:uncharacterized damage-inducible protein DinB